MSRINYPALLLLLLSVSCSATLEPSTDTLAQGRQLGWKLIWQEEFDYQGLPDPEIWTFETDGNDWDWGNGEDQFYTDSRLENASVQNGMLTITALREDHDSGKKYTSARINSRKTGGWKYGRFEVRARLPEGMGSWPAIWMMPVDSFYGGWPDSGEIDILETWGFRPDQVHSTVHTEKRNHKIGTAMGGQFKAPQNTLYRDFHIYSLEWYEDRLEFYFDDNHVYTYKKDKDDPAYWPFRQPFYLILNSAIGGDWSREYGPIDDSIFPLTYDIDYVRVYEAEYEIPAVINTEVIGHGTVETTVSGNRSILQAVPDSGMEFAHWIGDIGGSLNPLPLFNGRSKNVTAVFRKKGEMLTNGSFYTGLSRWTFWQDNSSVKSEIDFSGGFFSARIKKAGSYSWQAQLNQPVELVPGDYELQFEAKTNGIPAADAALVQNYAPYTSYWRECIYPGSEWTFYSFKVSINKTDPNSRIEFDFGNGKGSIFFRNISLIKL